MKVLFLTILTVFSLSTLSFGPKSNSIECPTYLDHEIRILDSQSYENLCKYKDKVIMVVNVASRCGFTYQYENLQKLYTKYNNEDSLRPHPPKEIGIEAKNRDILKKKIILIK